MSNFEIHKKNTHGRRSPKRMVSIMKSGVLGISADVHEWLGRPEEVEYLYDRTRKVLALRAAPGSQNAYRVSRAAKTGYAQVSAVTVCREYSIDNTKTTRHAPWMEDNLLCIDVREITK